MESILISYGYSKEYGNCAMVMISFTMSLACGSECKERSDFLQMQGSSWRLRHMRDALDVPIRFHVMNLVAGGMEAPYEQMVSLNHML